MKIGIKSNSKTKLTNADMIIIWILETIAFFLKIFIDMARLILGTTVVTYTAYQVLKLLLENR